MQSAWERMAMVAASGALGASCRYGVGLLSQSWNWAAPLPFLSTLVVNLIGSFAFGLIFELGVQAVWDSPNVRLVLLTGFLGSFTTFSAYSFDTLLLLQNRGWGWAVGYVIAQNGLGIGLALLGVETAKLVVTTPP